MVALYQLTRVLVWTLLIVGLVIGLLRTIAIRWVRLPRDDIVFTTSTLPTLGPGDLILTYRLGAPVFGDLVLCPEPGYPERFIIGRIIGEAGDEVQIKDGRPIVNDRPFATERNCDPLTFTYPHPDRDEETVTQQCSWEATTNGQVHMLGEIGIFKVVPEDRKYQIAEGQLFLISDNRVFPYDSRDYGTVDRSSCREIVFGRLVSGEGWSVVEKRLNYIQ